MPHFSRAVLDAITLTYATTVTPNAAQGSLFRCTATGNLTLADPTGGVDGQVVAVEITASGGTRTVTVGSNTVAIPAGEKVVVELAYNDSSGTWLRTFPPLNPAAPLIKSGYALYTASPHSTTTSATHGIGVLRLVPWVVARTLAISKIGAEVATGTTADVGAKVRLGIYSDDGTCYPGALLLDAGQIAGDSTTVQELTVSLTLNPGLYWVGGVVQSVVTTQPTLRTVNTWTPPVPLITTTTTPPGSNITTVGFQNTGVTGALPANFTATPAVISSAVRVYVKTA